MITIKTNNGIVKFKEKDIIYLEARTKNYPFEYKVVITGNHEFFITKQEYEKIEMYWEEII